MKYLFIVAHPDDEVLGSGGTIYNLIKTGNDVTVCFLSSKAEARNVKIGASNIEAQIKNSLNVLGVNKIIYGTFPNIKFNTIPHIEIVNFIERAIISSEPDVLITHFSDDLNSDHKITSECCDEAFRFFQRNDHIKPIEEYLYMEVLSSTDWNLKENFKPNYFYEIGLEALNKKIEALNLYEGALRTFPHPRSKENIQALAVYRGCQSKLNYAEAYMSVFKRRLK